MLELFLIVVGLCIYGLALQYFTAIKTVEPFKVGDMVRIAATPDRPAVRITAITEDGYGFFVDRNGKSYFYRASQLMHDKG